DQMLIEGGDDPHPDLLAAYAGQVLQRGRELGQHEAFLPLLEEAIQNDPSLDAYRAGLASMLAEMGELDRARATLDQVLANGVAGVRRAQELAASLALLAEACAAVGDAERADDLRRGLAPYAGRLIIIHSMVAGVGAADRFIGMMAQTCGDLDAAAACY